MDCDCALSHIDTSMRTYIELYRHIYSSMRTHIQQYEDTYIQQHTVLAEVAVAKAQALVAEREGPVSCVACALIVP